jgi:hypothetical protein
MSLDGVIESRTSWQFDRFDDELDQQMGAMVGHIEAAVMSRILNQEWSGILGEGGRR